MNKVQGHSIKIFSVNENNPFFNLRNQNDSYM